MNGSSVFSAWFEALFREDARFEVSLAGVASRMRAPRGWTARLHSPDEHLLYFVAEGEFTARIGSETRRIGTGDLLWGARGVLLHYTRVNDESLVIWRFRLRATDSNGDFLPFEPSYLHLQAPNDCERWMSFIVDEASEPGTHSEARMRGLVACLLSEIVRYDEKPDESHTLSRTQKATVRRVLSETNFLIEPRALAHEVGLSPDYFSRCFRRTYGLAPRQFLHRERLKLAALRLLESSQMVSEIAHELAYTDVFLFSRQFKAHFGQSPSHYRRTHSAIQLPSDRSD